jgi:hypothetical protein
MEKQINKKLETYIVGFKDKLKQKVQNLQFDDKQKINDLLEYLYEYERLSITKDDLVKRKRIKNSIPATNRCNAKRANNEQCTRRRKSDSEYCGTHSKGTPNGFVQLNQCGDCSIKKVELVLEEVNGIVYYIDSFKNVYRTEDILSGKENPQIIAKCLKSNGKTIITDFIET